MSTTFTGAGVDEHAVNGTRAAAEAAPNDLADIEAELLAEVETRTKTLDVPARPGWSVTYRTEVSAAERNLWLRKAKDPKAPGGLDTTAFALLVLASKCVAILRHGAPVPAGADDPTPRTFQSPSMQALYGVTRVVDVVTAFYGGHDRDADVEATATQVMQAAGWLGDGVESLDPTQPPSSG